MPRCADLQLTVSKPGAVVPAAGWPAGVPRARVALVTRSLDFYFALGCEVRSAADGWALLCCGRSSLVLIQATPRANSPVDLRIAASPLVRLGTPDVRALLRRLLAEGVPARTITRPGHTPALEIEVTDPDLHRVVIGQRRWPSAR